LLSLRRLYVLLIAALAAWVGGRRVGVRGTTMGTATTRLRVLGGSSADVRLDAVCALSCFRPLASLAGVRRVLSRVARSLVVVAASTCLRDGWCSRGWWRYSLVVFVRHVFACAALGAREEVC
jgi:hypothetical protein